MNITNEIQKIIFGGHEISKVMFGDVVVWSSSKLPDAYEWAEDTDFEFVTSSLTSAYLYNGKKGYFKYIGTKPSVAIPHMIKGLEMTSYFRLFEKSPASLKGVYSDNSNVTNMSWMFSNSSATTLDLSSFDTSNVTNMNSMFYNSSATTLDLSSFDTSNVTNMGAMFDNSSATTGYARTQADANKFNASSNKPSTLTFVVKP